MLSPTKRGWKHTVLYTFQGNEDGGNPYARLVFDAKGNLFGTAYAGGTGHGIFGCGVVFELSPDGSGHWSETPVYAFKGAVNNDGDDPTAAVSLDKAGHIYGTTNNGGAPGGQGIAYELVNSPTGWTETVLHRFGNGKDGAIPESNLILDGAGHLYGTTMGGGTADLGTVFEISP